MTEEAGAAEAQPTIENLALLSQPLAGPWPRFWARLFDISVLGLALASLLHLIGPSIFGDDFLMDPSYDPLVTLALLPFVLLLDALIQFVCGNTLGKMIAGIRIETTTLKRPRLGQLIQRNLLLWLKGLGLGIPIVSLFAMMACYMTVRSGRLTSWDAGNDVRVFNKSSNIYRTLLIFGAVLAFTAGLIALNLIGSQALANKIAADEIAKANEELPRQIDGQTRMDSIEMVAGLVIYSYTLADPSGAPSLTPLQISDLKSDRGKSLITQNYCRPDLTGPQTSPTYSARYRYRTVDGQVVLDLTLTPQACAGTTP